MVAHVIGTRGLATKIRLGSSGDTTPADTSEGIGMGDTLVPASLRAVTCVSSNSGWRCSSAAATAPA